MLIIPIGTDVRYRRPPVGNWLLIGLNVLIYLFTHHLGGALGAHVQTAYALDPVRPALHQYLTYQFLHGDWLHLTSNMLFLWIFGNAVCDRMGGLAYWFFYLAGGVFAGFGFALHNDNPMVGASGSIAAVTTAFLALFPRVHIDLLLWAIVVFTLQIPAMILIVFKIILWDNILAPRFNAEAATSNVAYSAHLAGYGFGFCVALLLLTTGALPRTPFDLVGLWDRWRRGRGTGPPPGRARPIVAEEMESRPLPPPGHTLVDELRERIAERLAERDLAGAAGLYRELRRVAPATVLPRAAQLELASYLAQAQHYDEAAAAYEALLAAYPAAADVSQVRLLLGLIYRRHLGNYPQAIVQLRQALEGLALEPQRALAREELTAAEAAAYGPHAG